MSPYKKALMPALFCTVLILSGCAGSDLAAWNQKISDAAHSLAGGSANSANDSDMPWMTKAGNTGPRQNVLHVYTLPIDVDTAAARIKSHYQLISSDELESLRTHEQSTIKGSYYKMGQEWKGSDRLVLEVEKSGAGSRLKVTYSSSDSSPLTDAYLGRLMKQQQVADGQVS